MTREVFQVINQDGNKVLDYQTLDHNATNLQEEEKQK